MYYDYFGLKQPPFKITPDTNLFFPGGERGAILDALVFAVTNGEGIIKVVGEVGSGKTMLCRMLQKELPASVEVVYLANPSLSPENILHAIAFELNLPVTVDNSKLQVMHQLQEYLLERHAQNKQVVVFVEEAQGMPLATMEEIRLLSNLETNQNKLLQIILFGQPELDQMISQRNIRQLRERITYSFQLNPFKTDDIKEYINTRLRSCGYRAGELFSDTAIRAIGRYSDGLVRRINILADKSMLAAYATNTNTIMRKHVRQAARDSEFTSGRWRYLLPSSVFMVLLTGAITFWYFQGNHTDNLSEGRNTDKVLSEGPAQTEPAGTGIQAMAEVREEQRIPVETAGVEEIEKESTAGETKVVLQLSDSLADEAVEMVSREDPGATSPTEVTGLEPDAGATVPGLPQPPDPEDVGVEDQLIGLNHVFRLQDEGDTRLTDQERIILNRQLKNLPPEEAVSQDAAFIGDECKLCWSIIYRPLVKSENL